MFREVTFLSVLLFAITSIIGGDPFKRDFVQNAQLLHKNDHYGLRYYGNHVNDNLDHSKRQDNSQDKNKSGADQHHINSQVKVNQHGIHYTYVNHHVPNNHHESNNDQSYGDNHHDDHRGHEQHHQGQHDHHHKSVPKLNLKKIKDGTKAYLQKKEKLWQRLVGKKILNVHHHHHHFSSDSSRLPTVEHHDHTLNHQNHIRQVHHHHHRNHHDQHALHNQHNNQHVVDTQTHHQNHHHDHHHQHLDQKNSPPEVLHQKPKEDINVHDVFSRIAYDSIGNNVPF